MRILRTKVRNYRVHGETEVAFRPDLTVVHGPNEVGKSTLVEALHRALFLSHKVGGKVREEMLRQPSGGHPEVEVEFQVEGERWLLRKRFGGGAAGDATLQDPGGRVLSGTEAEDRLAGLLGTEPVSSGGGANKALKDRWGHLWVWQGSAGENLLGSDTNPEAYEHGTLVARLQEVGEVSVQSALDQQVVSEVDRRWGSVFTPTGQVRAASELGAATRQRDDARARRDDTLQRLEAREITQRRFLDAARRLEEAEVGLPQLRSEAEALEARVTRVRELRRTLVQEQEVLIHRRKELERLGAELQALSSARTAMERLSHEMGPARDALQALKASQEADRARRDEIRKGKDEVDRAVAELRRAVERATRRRARSELAQRIQRLEAAEAATAELREELVRSGERLKVLPPVTEEVLTELRGAATAAEVARTELRSLAAGIRAVRLGSSTAVDGVDMAQGEFRQITEPTRLTVGDDVELEVIPGGGGSTREVQARVGEAEAHLAAGLAALGVGKLDEAVRLLAQRNALLQAQQELERRLEPLPGSETDAEALARARDELARLEVGEGDGEGSGEAGFQGDPEEWKGRLDEAEGRVSGLQRQLDTLQEQLDHRAAEIQAAEVWLQGQERERNEAEGRIRAILERYGNEEALEAARSVARDAVHAGDMALAGQQEELTRLEAVSGDGSPLQPGPGGVEAALEAVRHRRSAMERARQEAHDERLRLEGELNAGAGLDLDGELEQREAALESLEVEVARLKREADMLDLLKRLLAEEQNRLAARFSAPLQRAMEGYLACLVPEGSTPALDYEASKGFHSLTWRRGNGVAWEFDALSGGAKEQLMAALRLAMAEVLAGVGEDGEAPESGSLGDRPGLPVVFDDSFVNADPRRMSGVNRMLRRASERGLQVLLFTCDPSGVVELAPEGMVELAAAAG